uniref:Nuclear pore complex protein Nup98-Nup96 n=1 Tax=Panagrolaimus superbus TaxID=310955 RepID=A0A914YAY5_9BILA
MFGSGGGMFGNKSFTSSTPAFGSTFGSTTFGSNDGPDGTTIAFEPYRGTDTMIRNGDNKEIQTKNMCITSMDQYKMKSIEELRVADYAANRKGNTGTSTGGGGLFGSAAKPASGGLFGSTTSAFGQQQPATGGSLFGQTTNNTSSTGGGLFGSTAAKASTNLFGSTTSAFGQQQQPATGGNLFASDWRKFIWK